MELNNRKQLLQDLFDACRANEELKKTNENVNKLLKNIIPDLEISEKDKNNYKSSFVPPLYGELLDRGVTQVQEVITGDDPLTFKSDDKEQAKQETMACRSVIFSSSSNNRKEIETAITDAFTHGICCIAVKKEDDFAYYELDDKRADILLSEGGEVVDKDGKKQIKIVKAKPSIKIEAINPKNLYFTDDTTSLIDHDKFQYFAITRMYRRGDIKNGIYDDRIVDEINAHVKSTAIGSIDDSNYDYICLVEHFVKVKDGNDSIIKRFVTDDDIEHILEEEEVEIIPYAVGSIYTRTRSLLGDSLWHLVSNPLRALTMTYRAFIEQIYDTIIDPRYEIKGAPSDFKSLGMDLLDKRARVIKTDNASINLLPSNNTTYSLQEAQVKFLSMIEQRTGLTATGTAGVYKPEDLHETKGVSDRLMDNAGRRIEKLVRCYAESLLKNLYLVVHNELRKFPDVWVLHGNEIIPSRWGSKDDVEIVVGRGSEKAEQKREQNYLLANVYKQIIELQGGVDGALIGIDEARELAKKQLNDILPDGEKFIKSDEEYMQYVQQQQQQQQQEQPFNKEQYKIDKEIELKKYQIDIEAQLKNKSLELDQFKITEELKLKREQLQVESQIGVIRAENDLTGNSFGGDASV